MNEEIKQLLDMLYWEINGYKLFLLERSLSGEYNEWMTELAARINLHSHEPESE
jgi:hypothetical protein